MTKEIRDLKFVNMALTYVSDSSSTSSGNVSRPDIYLALAPELDKRGIPYRYFFVWQFKGQNEDQAPDDLYPESLTEALDKFFAAEGDVTKCSFCTACHLYMEVQGVLMDQNGIVDSALQYHAKNCGIAPITLEAVRHMSRVAEFLSINSIHTWDYECREQYKELFEKVFELYEDYQAGSGPHTFFEITESKDYTQRTKNNHKTIEIAKFMASLQRSPSQLVKDIISNLGS